MPHQWSSHVDNATGEGKNQIVGKFHAWLTWKEKFDCDETTQNEVGHTHNEIGQRFAECGDAIFKLPFLQAPKNLCKAIEIGVQPRKGRRMVVEQVHAAWVWKMFCSVANTHDWPCTDKCHE